MKSMQILLLSIVALYSYEMNAHLPAAAAAGAGAGARAISPEMLIDAIDNENYDMFNTWLDNNPNNKDAHKVLDLLLTPSGRQPQAIALAIPLAKKLINNGDNRLYKLVSKKLEKLENAQKQDNELNKKLAGMGLPPIDRPTSLEEMKKIDQEIIRMLDRKLNAVQ